MYFVYILACRESGRSYVGPTDDLLRRFQAHLEGWTRTTRQKLVAPFVVCWEPHPTRAAAVRRERCFKSGSGHRVKRKLIDAALAES